MRGAVFRSMALSTFACYVFFLLEWLFHVTKPSFLSTLTTLESLTVLADPYGFHAQVHCEAHGDQRADFSTCLRRNRSGYVEFG